MIPSLTIIVPTYNRPRDVGAVIEQLLGQSHIDFELFVIDQSDEPEAAAVRAMCARIDDPRLAYLHLAAKGLPNARNEGLVRARGSVVLFVDDDVILLSEDFIAAHLRCYADQAVGGVTGRHVECRMRMNARHTACHVSWGGRTIVNLFGTQQTEIGSCKGSNMSFRMAAVHQVGGFDRRTHMLEDTDFSVRVRAAGWRLLFEPAAELVHLSSPAGGVREAPGLITEGRRFSSTAYYVLKHRGAWGMVAFALTFSLIALQRAYRFRSVGTVLSLYRAAMLGVAEARRGPDEALSPSA